MTGDQPSKSEQPEATAAKPRKWRFGSSFVHYLIVLLIGLAGAVGLVAAWDHAQRDPDLDLTTVAHDPLTIDDEAQLSAALALAWAGAPVELDSLPDRLHEPAQPVYVAFRAEGKRLEHLWRTAESVGGSGTMWDVLNKALSDGRERLGDRFDSVTHVEINLTHSYRHVPYEKFDYGKKVPRSKRPELLYDYDEHGVPAQMGVRGLEIRHGERLRRSPPTWFVANNRLLIKQLGRTRRDWHLTKEQMAKASYRAFEADQVLLDLTGESLVARVMFRGNQIVAPSDVTQASTDALVTGMASWLINNVDEDGALTYHYFPSSASEEKGNNMIRQWMATNAMIRWAHDRKDQAVFDLVERNIDYNLANFFHYERDGVVVTFEPGEAVPDDVLGVIEYGRKTKLGALGLTAMALWLHPKRDEWRDEIAALSRTIDQLHQPSGKFTSFYKGAPRGAGADKKYHHYYPGEAMLFWAVVYAETKDPELLAKFKRSFTYYSEWHLDPSNRNPAFVPWHLQANWTMWAALGDDEQAFKDALARFMFETADWLIATMQRDQWDNYVHPDERGRFYSKPFGFGKPHASATGVYIEGLIDAWQLARALGHLGRREHYRVALVRAARSMMQLQFVDEVDMFYVRDRRAVEGGIRTTLYDNRIRCDNVQHPMMGLIKMVRMFEADEYDANEAYAPACRCSSEGAGGQGEAPLALLGLLGLGLVRRRRRSLRAA